MSVVTPLARMTVRRFAAAKGKTPLVCLTAYTAPMARLLDPHADMLLVGDSVGAVIHGLPTTVPVTLEMMILHGQAVMRGTEKALVVIDLPFGSYEESPEAAFRTAVRVLKEIGAPAVKLEGGAAMAPTIRFLADRGIPVLAHIGLQPQQVHLNGYKVAGRSEGDRERLLADARAVAEAGAFAVVIEGTVEALAREVSEAIAIPTIGIGASAGCDGQILVTEDMLGLFDRTPSFVRRYAELGRAIGQAAGAYAEDVRARAFPGPDHVYGQKPRGAA
jgi:3-methyl-2-oxobutanoate hydroxymethyltransferase